MRVIVDDQTRYFTTLQSQQVVQWRAAYSVEHTVTLSTRLKFKDDSLKDKDILFFQIILMNSLVKD